MIQGYKNVKKHVIKSLELGNYQSESRKEIEAKNLLLTGEISAADLIKHIKSSNGNNHTTSQHHHQQNVTVHIIKCNGWYIKFYFVDIEYDDSTMFISVHQS